MIKLRIFIKDINCFPYYYQEKVYFKSWQCSFKYMTVHMKIYANS